MDNNAKRGAVIPDIVIESAIHYLEKYVQKETDVSDMSKVNITIAALKCARQDDAVICTIVKVQVPIAGNGEPLALIYNEDRSIEMQAALEDVEAHMNGRLKAFFYMNIHKDGDCQFAGEAPWQKW